MLDRFASFLREENILPDGHRILIAVSGGVDSMVLLDLFIKSGFSLGIAHVNYGMRASASEDDEKMVDFFAKEHNIPIYISHFPAELKSKGNFQQKARDFRYSWFNKLCVEHHYDFLATGHHADDEAEGFLMNLLRASGLNGLSGLRSRSANILRPLLGFDKYEIYAYAQSFNVPFREDESNAQSKYLRNAIRNTVIPVLRQLNSDAVRQVQRSTQHLAESSALLDQLIETANYLQPSGKGWTIPLLPILEIKESKALLFIILRKFGFNRTQSDNLLDAETGRLVSNDTYCARKERNIIYIDHCAKMTDESELLVNGPGVYGFRGMTLTFAWFLDAETMRDMQSTAVLSFEEDPFPLIIRSKRQGDKFLPCGMEGHSKTVKKFFTDLKLNARQKAMTILIEGKYGIYYVAPYRIAEGYTYNPEKKFSLVISYSD